MLLENKREGLRGEIGTDGRGKSVKERERRKRSDEAIQKAVLESKGSEKADVRKSGEDESEKPAKSNWPEEKELLDKCDGLATAVGTTWAMNYLRPSGVVRLVGAVSSRRARGTHGEVHGSAHQALSAQTGARNSRRGWTDGQSFPR